MRRGRVLAWAVLAALMPAVLRAQTVEAAREAWHTGAYDDAIAAYRTLASRPGAPPQVHRDLTRVLLEVGRSQEAERHLRSAGGGVQLANALGEALLATGRWEHAEVQFRAAANGGANDSNVARANLAELLWNRGRHTEALRLFDSFIYLYNRGARLSAAELMAVGQAVRRLAVTNPQLFQDALMAFDQAAAAAPGDPLPKILAGELFLEKYVAPDAHASFKEALARNPRHPRALLGEARALEFDDAPGTSPLIEQALATNPRSVPARVLRARLALGAENPAAAAREAEEALAINPASLDALAMLAAARFLSGDQAGFEAARDRALAINPVHADLFATVAEMVVQHRRYPEGVAIAARGVALDSLSWSTLGLLGMNQLRVGAIAEGRANLGRAFRGDPYNPWFKNTLDLLDTFARYRTIPTRHFHLFLHGEEADLLAPYVEALAEEAYASLAERYGMEPTTPIRLELFPRHADFSVRTLGITGLGALGVAFGPVLVMDSPSALEPGEFNWGSTLWHELAHSFHMAMTGNRIPRWFTEGLAVHEQRAARPGWGHPISIAFLQAYHAGRLPRASELNDGFMRPDYPEQVIHSYFLASMVFAWMEQNHGPDAALRMLRGYGEGRDTPALVGEVLGGDLDGFDLAVDAYIRTRFAGALQAIAPLDDPLPPDADLDAVRAAARRQPGHFPTRLRLGQMLVEAGREDEAEAELREALRLFPTYSGVNGPYLHLARIHRKRGELKRAAAALSQLGNLNETAYEVSRLEADVRREMGDLAGAARALERTVFIHPYEISVHQELADLHSALGAYEAAVQERRAVVALDPVDRADAHYRLAHALLEAAHVEEAWREVLRALEVAPNYEAALELLLEIRAEGR